MFALSSCNQAPQTELSKEPSLEITTTQTEFQKGKAFSVLLEIYSPEDSNVHITLGASKNLGLDQDQLQVTIAAGQTKTLELHGTPKRAGYYNITANEGWAQAFHSLAASHYLASFGNFDPAIGLPSFARNSNPNWVNRPTCGEARNCDQLLYGKRVPRSQNENHMSTLFIRLMTEALLPTSLAWTPKITVTETPLPSGGFKSTWVDNGSLTLPTLAQTQAARIVWTNTRAQMYDARVEGTSKIKPWQITESMFRSNASIVLQKLASICDVLNSIGMTEVEFNKFLVSGLVSCVWQKPS
jgi:hypothetical protein